MFNTTPAKKKNSKLLKCHHSMKPPVLHATWPFVLLRPQFQWKLCCSFLKVELLMAKDDKGIHKDIFIHLCQVTDHYSYISRPTNCKSCPWTVAFHLVLQSDLSSKDLQNKHTPSISPKHLHLRSHFLRHFRDFLQGRQRLGGFSPLETNHDRPGNLPWIMIHPSLASHLFHLGTLMIWWLKMDPPYLLFGFVFTLRPSSLNRLASCVMRQMTICFNGIYPPWKPREGTC